LENESSGTRASGNPMQMDTSGDGSIMPGFNFLGDHSYGFNPLGTGMAYADTTPYNMAGASGTNNGMESWTPQQWQEWISNQKLDNKTETAAGDEAFGDDEL